MKGVDGNGVGAATPRRRGRAFQDAAAAVIWRAAAGAVVALLFALAAVLIYKSRLLWGRENLGELLFSADWNPAAGVYGFLPIILGTAYVTGIALVIAVPISVFSAIYVAEYLRGRLRDTVKSFVDVLAGIPSVVYGMCAIIVLVPVTRRAAVFLGYDTTGFCVLTAGLVLAVMVFPIIISICVDVFRAVPYEVREAAQALGASKWQTTKVVAFHSASWGVFSAVLLGFGRAFGETIAVAMVVGNLPRIPANIFDAAATIPSIVASTYGELMSIPRYDAAIMFLALLLIVVVTAFNVLARLVQRRVGRGVEEAA